MAFGSTRLVMVVLILGLTVGCGSRRPPLGKVSGTVRFDGKPIADGAIIFEVPGNRPASGKIIDGALRDITTWDTGDGVPVGTARVAVHAFAKRATHSNAELPEDGSGAKASVDMSGYMGGAESLIPARYNDPATSSLTVTIEPGDNNVSLDLKP